MTRPLAALGVLGLLLAGCLGGQGTTTSASTPSTPTLAPGLRPRESAADARPALVEPQAMPQVLVAKTTLGGLSPTGGGPGSGPGAAEPNLAVAADGTLYASNPCAIWRSGDGGKSWKETAHKGQTGCGDGDIALDGAGTLYWLGLGGGIPFQVSTDRGESFSKALDLSDKGGFDREWIDATPDGKLFATWRGNDKEGSAMMAFRATLDGGATWQPQVKAGADGDGGPVAHDPTTHCLYLPVVDLGPLAGVEKPAVHVYTSSDLGGNWTEHKAATLPRSSPAEPNGYNSDFPVVSVDTNGTAYLVYSADATGLPAGQAPPEETALFGIYLQASKDGGATWSAPRLISTPGKDARMPWVAAGKPGRVAVAWYEGTVGTAGETMPDAWNVRLWESVTADQDAPVAKTVTLTSSPNHIGTLCTSGTGCIASDRSLLDFFELAITPNGQPVAVWSSSIGGTGVGVAAQGTDIYFGGLSSGTPLL
ncbi:MAG: glycoside hydrolase [Halobacteriales archaeon]|nr:glycoside hydrolase [Halobacteriales archaeon]